MHTLEKKRYRTSALIWLALGLVFVLTDTVSGWFFLVLGLAFLARGTDQADAWAHANPRLATVVLVGLTLVVLTTAGTFLLLKFL
jgi:uncharacterized membrane protein YbaN (DUF454 family)